MATVKMFAIFDSKAEAFLPPFFQSSTGLAIRAFETAANDTGHQFNKYPLDFCLMEIGTFDDMTGEIIQDNAPMNLGLAENFITTTYEEQLEGSING